MSQDSIEIYNQGYCYYTGTEGYPLNYRKALECFQGAAELGNSAAMNYLGVMYQYGEGVSKSTQIAADWYEKALQTDCDNAYAAHNLGCLYYFGDGVPVNIHKAFQLFKASVDLGAGNTTSIYPNSCYMAGVIMAEQYKNNREAVPFFMDAANYGDIPEAWYNLGWLCENGAMDVARDHIPGTACRFYKKAAKLGMVEAMDAVGRLYASVKMLDEAREWISRAASMGYEPAKKRLKMLNFAQSGGSLWELMK